MNIAQVVQYVAAGAWLLAIGLVLLLALSLIFMRFYKNGFTTSAAGNHQRINAAP